MTSVKEIYESPEMEVVSFDSEDIITTSIITGENETEFKPW